MFSKSLNSNKSLVGLLLLGLPFAPAPADEVQYFDHGIDFWQPFVPAMKSAPADGAFPWHQYLDPKNKEFFREGDYTPPEPFMEIVRNPTDANLKMWFGYISKKNELSSRLQTRMQEYLVKNGPAIPALEKERVSAQLAALPRSAPTAQRYRFRLYFDSHCPHCKRMLSTMAELQTQGYFVEAKQVDQDTRELSGVTIPVEQALPGEMKEKEIKSVPVLLVGDLFKKVVYRINGYQTTAQVLAALPKGDEQ
ncbi:hypothetical protein WDW37_07305 [Bdellovibrionota bacterium FG-1]